MIARSTALLLQSLICVLLLTACSPTIKPIGSLGHNTVYSITNNSFLTASEMLVVLNKKGDIAAYSGGTTAGAGTIGLQTGATLLTAGAIVYAARTVANPNVKGIPSNVHVEGNIDSKHQINIQH